MDDVFPLLPPQGSEHLLAIDATYYVRRAWHGHVNEKRNEPHRVAPSALRRIATLLRGQQPTHTLCAAEGVDSIRKIIFPEYKANRPPKPDGLIAVECQVETALAGAKLTTWRFAGYEADDVLHAAALLGRDDNIPVVLATLDKDLECLASSHFGTVLLHDGKVLDEEAVARNWGIIPSRLPEVLALAGDTADNIPHVKGWGPKAAVAILTHAKTLFLSDLLRPGNHWYVPEKYRKAFVENRDLIAVAYELVKLRGAEIRGKLDMQGLRCWPLDAAESLMESADWLEGREETF